MKSTNLRGSAIYIIHRTAAISSYEIFLFRTPKELYLKIDRIQALPKGENLIEIDFDKKEIVSQPANWPITISNITSSSFQDKIVKSSDSFRHQLFGEAMDVNGHTLESSGYSLLDSEDYLEYELNYRMDNITNQVYLNSSSNYLDGSATLKIDLK